jgi:hypothetical protein
MLNKKYNFIGFFAVIHIYSSLLPSEITVKLILIVDRFKNPLKIMSMNLILKL